ncbi:MAG: Hsp70 family protein [Acutalibacteraceae bacterium]|nr:Hsp70 family protein [Acutalibacteraceae bacterium]
MITGDFIGVDFGTTNTAVVFVKKDEYGEQVIPLTDSGYPFASLLAIYSDHVDFGNNVKKYRENISSDCKIISSFKSLLGTEKTIAVNGNTFTAKQIVAKYFECVKQFIQEKHSIEIKEASLSFPVDFTPEARQELREAALAAGITVNNMVSESTAAYLATYNQLKGLSRVMVIDWGGGTLDISILEVENKKVREVSVYGAKIGGDDIDRELAERVHSMLNLKCEDRSKCVQFREMPAEQQAKMICACEKAKIQISELSDNYLLTIRDYGEYGTKTIPISFELFEDIVKPIIRNRVLTVINDAMERAEFSKASIDAVIIAGGSSNLRTFENAILNLFGDEKVILPDNIQFVSAKGAALMPFIGGNFKLNDGIGIVMSDDTVYPIFQKDVDGVGSEIGPYTFSLTEDSYDAHFIFTNSNGRFVYEKINIPTKGFLKERLTVTANITDDQIANIKIHSSAVPDKLKDHTVKIKNLTYHYDLSEFDN